jgi:hypothetical protein
LLAKQLNKYVGKHTNNNSLRDSLQMLEDLYTHPKAAEFQLNLRLGKLILRLVIGFHLAVIFGNCFSMYIFPFLAPWWAVLLALPVFTVCINWIFGRHPCVLTNIENWIRVKLGKPRISTFLKHYILPYFGYKESP